MDRHITTNLFSDYLNCDYKAYLKINGESATPSDYEKLEMARGLDHRRRAGARCWVQLQIPNVETQSPTQ